MRKLIATICGAAAISGSAFGTADAASGRAAIDMLVGNTIAGETHGRAFFTFFAKDGAIKALYGTKRDDGRWAAQDGKLCLTPPVGQPCFTVQVDGDAVTLTGPGTIQAKVLPGNAKNLN